MQSTSTYYEACYLIGDLVLQYLRPQTAHYSVEVMSPIGTKALPSTVAV